MKRLFMKKAAGMLALLMTLSMIIPVIAFAGANFYNLKFSNGTVTGQVYVSDDVYNDPNFDNTVTVKVYFQDAEGNIAFKNGEEATVTVSDVAYSHRSDAGDVYYNFSESIPSTVYETYNKIFFKYFYLGQEVQSQAVDRNYDNGNTGGYPGGFFPPTGSGIVNADGTVNKAALIAALQANENAVVMTPSDVVYLPADALIHGKYLTLKMEDGTSYTLPIASLKLEELAKSLGVELSQLTIRVEMKKVTGETATKLEEAVKKAGVKALADAVDFKVFAVTAEKEVEIKNFDQYVKRTLALKEELADAAKATGVVFDAVTGKLSYVPASFATENGKTIATLLRKGNSIYTVVSAEAVSFKDLPANHWGKAEIEALAAKLIVQGTGKDLFTPNRNITRAEFATMIARALGLDASAATSTFKDVASNKWYTGAVAAAAEAGIVKGTGAGKFSPDANITRKEIAAMVVRAMAYAGKDAVLTDAEASEVLAAYTDAANLGWAKGEVAAAIKSGIVKGQSSTKVVADAKATRAEGATMIYRMLDQVGFIK